MAERAHLELLDAANNRAPAGEAGTSGLELQAAAGSECARSLFEVPNGGRSGRVAQRVKELDRKLKQASASKIRLQTRHEWDEDERWLYDHLRLVDSTMAELHRWKRELSRLPHARRASGEAAPRTLFLAEELLATLRYRFAEAGFSAFVHGFQTVTALSQRELNNLALSLKLALLEQLVRSLSRQEEKPATGSGEGEDNVRAGAEVCIRSLLAITEASWKELLEPLTVFEQVLRQDPAGAYARMDFESRAMYRAVVTHLAAHSEHSESEIAEMALTLARASAQRSQAGPRMQAASGTGASGWGSRMAARRAHIGYYLVAEGAEELRQRAGVRLPWAERLQSLLRRNPDEFYFSGIELLTLVITVAIIWRGIDIYSLGSIFFAALVLLLPCSQSAVEVMNYLVTSLLQPRMLPKLDFSRGIPPECATMVVVPALLLNEKQVRQLVHDLEVRYVGNLSPNLHFAVLTDLPDSTEQPLESDPRVELCAQLVRELNEKYAGNGAGSFSMFHRHRVYNPREGVWMGWERKRGKLLDFNKLILGDYDSFPVKVGDSSILPRIRYVLTLDVDTELPRGAAQKLVGTLAHPLCQAIIDPERNIVTQGFGILQPRVGVSVQSASRSRLAAIFSGQTGFDLYTRAISDVYQDLYGEGSFTGKGLYEVRTLHRVLDHRFPRNSLLSHDLIEGAYTRAGLVSDVEVIDKYPSHYSAYVRRKHRWLRGDWQIVEWLFPRVPDESGRRVRNPISLISRWKILDNLRRSVVAPATMALLLLGWTLLHSSALYWTLVTLLILFVPPWVQFAFAIVRGLLARRAELISDAFRVMGAALINILTTLTFLAHNTLVATDAIWRALYRRMISRQRLLEWETAAEAELGQKRTPVDLYLSCTPAIAAVIGALLGWKRPSALPAALPILALWAGSKLVSLWLDRPPYPLRKAASRKDELFLRRAALRTWRYFAQFSDQEQNWLIPDSVQEEPAKVMSRTSVTNIGFLLNARQAACEFGYLTVPEFQQQTRRTMQTLERLPRYRGHWLNWYDTQTLSAPAPRFVSSVDSGNLAASLIALKGGCLALLQKPLLSPVLLEGYEDHVRELLDLRLLSRSARRLLRQSAKLPWLERLLVADQEVLVMPGKAGKEAKMASGRWFSAQLKERKTRARQLASDYLPWLLPEFDSLRTWLNLDSHSEQIPLSQLPGYISQLQEKLRQALDRMPGPSGESQGGPAKPGPSADAVAKLERLLPLLEDAQGRCECLVRELRQIAADAERWVREMDFSFLLDRRRKLLSIGYDVEAGKLHDACYDLLASESRVASFIAIAKGDVPQELWLRLGRTYVTVDDRPTLLSWTGTMFEYLMPAVWMRSYRGSLLQRAMEGAVRAQQNYAAEKRIPWGISESGYAEVDEAGNYQYRAFTVPELALQEEQSERLVVAPYATALALAVDPAALKNMRRMAKQGWFGAYGFYEAADFTPLPGRPRRQRFALVKSWMAHHQGMSLLAIANFLDNDVVQQWFHRDVQVQATELLLQERSALQAVKRLKKPPQPYPAPPQRPAEKILAKAS
jgi:hypothetical protein